MKRLADARTRGSHCCCDQKALPINNDGDSSSAYTATRCRTSQVIEKALAVAGLLQKAVSDVEAHGTATPLGDPMKLWS